MGDRTLGIDLHDLTHIDLFSGIGGFALAAQWAGFRTVAFCEIELFCQEVLKARFGAIANTKSERLERRGHGETRIKKKAVRLFSTRSIKRPILYSDIRDFDGSRFRGATLLTGGFPCQPFSHAGKRRGKEDDRAIWPQMLRVIHEARPAWVIGENVSGLISMELDQVLSDLEMEGYAARTFHIGAVGVNAPHRRMRVWIVGSRADAQDALLGRNGRWGDGDTPRLRRALQTAGSDSDAPDAERFRCQVGEWVGDGKRRGQEQEGTHAPEGSWDIPWIEVATRLCRVDARVSNRVDRLKALGNAIVPQVAYEIIKEIARIEYDR